MSISYIYISTYIIQTERKREKEARETFFIRQKCELCRILFFYRLYQGIFICAIVSYETCVIRN